MYNWTDSVEITQIDFDVIVIHTWQPTRQYDISLSKADYLLGVDLHVLVQKTPLLVYCKVADGNAVGFLLRSVEHGLEVFDFTIDFVEQILREAISQWLMH